MQNEIWKEIPGYGGRYLVSQSGKVYSSYLKRELRPANRGNGYYFVVLSQKGQKKNISIHRLVAMAFVPNPKGLSEVDHIDGNKSNNLYTNLRFVSHCDNMKNPNTEPKRYNAIRKKQGIPVIAFHNGKEIGKYSCLMEAAKDLGLSCSNIAMHLKGRCARVKGYNFKRDE